MSATSRVQLRLDGEPRPICVHAWDIRFVGDRAHNRTFGSAGGGQWLSSLRTRRSGRVRRCGGLAMVVLRHVVAPRGGRGGRGDGQVVTGRGWLVVVSGPVAKDEHGGLGRPWGFRGAGPCRYFENLRRCLAGAGVGFDEVMKLPSPSLTSRTFPRCARPATPLSIPLGRPRAQRSRWRPPCSPAVT